MIKMVNFLSPYTFIIMIVVFANSTFAAGNFKETTASDPRLIRSSSSPEWLAAVGKFYVRNAPVPSTMDSEKAGNWKSCSITLVSNHRDRDSNIAMSDGHCVRSWYEGGTAGNRRFSVGEHKIIFQPNSGDNISDLQIVEILGYESSPGDYVILRLNRAIPNHVVKPLTHTNEPARDSLLLDEDYIKKFKPWATAAGYSTDITLGQKGKNLTYHAGCYLNGGESARKDSRCTSYGGASGGPIVVTVDRSLSEWTEDTTQGTEYLLVGLIQGGLNGNDNATYWTPNSYYRDALTPILERFFGPSDVF